MNWRFNKFPENEFGIPTYNKIVKIGYFVINLVNDKTRIMQNMLEN